MFFFFASVLIVMEYMHGKGTSAFNKKINYDGLFFL